MKKFAKLLGYDPIAKQTSVRTEITAGIVTFLAMAYILTVNPDQILVGVENAAAIFAMPLFAVIPSAATAAALIYVGVLMMKSNIKEIDFKNPINATSAFLTIVIMLLSYSITTGIGVGLLSYTIMSTVVYAIESIKYAFNKKEKPTWNVSVVTIVVSLLFCLYFFVPANLF